MPNLLSYPLPNMINGVSQQAPSQRRDTQAEDQINCINSPVDGAIPRPPSTIIRHIPLVDLTDCKHYDILRTNTEKYHIAVRNGDLKAYNMLTGVECTVSFPNGKAYLGTGGVDAETAFAFSTVEDYTFVCNKTVMPAMAAAIQPTRPYEAVLYFRAAAFLETYSVTVTQGGTSYTWSIKTFDNASTVNTAWVKTDFLTGTLCHLMQGIGTANVTIVNNPGVLSTLFPGMTATYANASCFIISSATDFTISTSDGAANTNFIGLKGSCQKFSDLPAVCFNGFTIRVRGANAAVEDDWWAQYQIGTETGFWQETAAPGTKLGLDDTKMPWALTSTGLNTFVFDKITWGKRVSGDGVVSAKEPYFVGIPIQDIFYHRARFGIMTDGTVNWSASGQLFTFFPASAQTRVAEDPILYRVNHTKVANLRHAVVYNGQLMLWASGTQFLVSSSTTFDEASLQVSAVTEFLYRDTVKPEGSGSNVYFAADRGSYSSLWEFYVTSQGTARDANDVSSHVPAYVPVDVIRVSGSQTMNMLVCLCSGDRTKLWVHNYFVSGEQKLQSAWNMWQLPANSRVLWMKMDGAYMRLVVQRPTGITFEVINCQSNQTDTSSPFLTRLDRRWEPASLVVTYNSTTKISTIVIPDDCTDQIASLRVVSKPPYAMASPGSEYPILSIVCGTTTTITVQGNLTGGEFWVGTTFSSSYTFSAFWPKDQKGVAIPYERLQVRYIDVTHSNTGYYRAEVSVVGKTKRVYEFTGRTLGNPLNTTDSVPAESGTFRFPVKAKREKVSVTLVTDSWFPCAWQSANYSYTATQRAVRIT